jgi:hypothetical protein
VVESQPSKLLVAGSIPVSRSSLRSPDACASLGAASQAPREGCRAGARSAEADRTGCSEADVAQLAERVLGKDEVTSSILVIGSSHVPHRGEKRTPGSHKPTEDR